MSTAWLWVLLAIVGSSGGNVLMKYASQRGTGLDVFLSLPFVAGAALFGGGLMCYMRALHSLPLAVAYPAVVGASIVAITTMAIVFFGERVNAGHVVGMVLIFAGLVLLARNGSAALS